MVEFRFFLSEQKIDLTSLNECKSPTHHCVFTPSVRQSAPLPLFSFLLVGSFMFVTFLNHSRRYFASFLSFLPSSLPGALTTRRHISRRSILALPPPPLPLSGARTAHDGIIILIHYLILLRSVFISSPVRQGGSARFSTAMRRFTRNLGVLYCRSCLHRKW